jgi:uncharacterized membrane protein (DUF485 family)
MNRSPAYARESTRLFALLIKRKKRYLAWMSLTFLTVYFLLPILIAVVPDWMNTAVYGRMTVAWIWAVAQCLLTLLLATFYIVKARQFDRLARQVAEAAESEENL